MSPSTPIPEAANCPSVTPDGKYLFYSSFKRDIPKYSKTPLTYKEKIKWLTGPENGSSDIYWIDAKILEQFRPEKK